MCGCMCVTAVIKLLVHFFPQAQWLSLLHTRIWENLPKTSSVKASVSEEIYLTCICNCCSSVAIILKLFGLKLWCRTDFQRMLCVLCAAGVYCSSGQCKEIIFTALPCNIYVFIYFFKYPNFFSTGYGILKLDVKTKSQSGVVSITVVTGCV